MRILLIMDPGIAVPPLKYGGIERIVALLADEYIKLGHDVTLLAGPNSYCKGKTITYGINDMHRSRWQKATEALFVWRYILNTCQQYDVVHNFGRLIYLLPILNRKVLKVMSYQRSVTKANIRFITRLPHQKLIFTACSDACRSTGDVAGNWHTVYNTADFSNYHLSEQVNAAAPLMFLGRLEQIKGAHTAIQVAKATKQRLWIAGNIPNLPQEADYFQSSISNVIDGNQIQYIGELTDVQKNYYLRQSKGLLFPIEWEEPFGIVMIEAMACGTPVIAFKCGAVPEVIDEDKTGFIVEDIRQMTEKVELLKNLNRTACRNKALERFDITTIAEQYLTLMNGS